MMLPLTQQTFGSGGFSWHCPGHVCLFLHAEFRWHSQAQLRCLLAVRLPAMPHADPTSLGRMCEAGQVRCSAGPTQYTLAVALVAGAWVSGKVARPATQPPNAPQGMTSPEPAPFSCATH